MHILFYTLGLVYVIYVCIKKRTLSRVVLEKASNLAMLGIVR